MGIVFSLFTAALGAAEFLFISQIFAGAKLHDVAPLFAENATEDTKLLYLFLASTVGVLRLVEAFNSKCVPLLFASSLVHVIEAAIFTILYQRKGEAVTPDIMGVMGIIYFNAVIHVVMTFRARATKVAAKHLTDQKPKKS
jgi:hypothetical protein